MNVPREKNTVQWIIRKLLSISRVVFIPLLFRLRIKKCPDAINIGSGTQRIPGFLGIDVQSSVDLPLDLSRKNLPFPEKSMDYAICISAINYFTRQRAVEIITETYRVLKPGGIARFGVQDLELISQKYINKDLDFFFQKLPDGRDRFEGETLGDKYASWFYGYKAGNSSSRYFYDFDSLAILFKQAGFSVIERKKYLESRLPNIELIDNRPEQMFFLEAVK